MTAARTGLGRGDRARCSSAAPTLDAREKWYGETRADLGRGRESRRRGRRCSPRTAPTSTVVRPLRSSLRAAARGPVGPAARRVDAADVRGARERARRRARRSIAGGANLDLADPDGATALVIAIINAHYDFAALLLDAGADPNVVDNEAGMGAALRGRRHAPARRRPRPRRTRGPSGLLDAVDIVTAAARARRGSERRAQAPIMQRQHTFGDGTLGAGATPLMRAAKSGDIELVKRAARGAAPIRRTTLPNGTTALMSRPASAGATAARWRRRTIRAATPKPSRRSRSCCRIGLEPRRQDKDGDTALHAAVGGRGSEAIITLSRERSSRRPVDSQREGSERARIREGQARRRSARGAARVARRRRFGP